ncbi:MAG TPA: molybdopterin-dependent oxidoreductase, partial [Steroidobacteraceae bacterium]|nr:molybdopterin-dependent oxidoreductase [Steroidobacteraceae bacterium]
AAVVAAAAQAAGRPVPAHLEAAVHAAQVSDAHRAVARALLSGEKRAVWLGALAARHAAFADLRALAAALAQLAGASLGRLAEGGNGVGAYLAGALPHREAGGKAVAEPGLTARDMLRRPLRACVLVGGIEPSIDALDADSSAVLGRAELVIALTPFAGAELRRVAHVLLPIGTFAEVPGTYVNCEGLWQSQEAAAALVGAARPGWKVLRVLGNLLGIAGFEYQSCAEVRAELERACAALVPRGYAGTHVVTAAAAAAGGAGLVDVPMYQTDALVRRAPALQKTREGRTPPASY